MEENPNFELQRCSNCQRNFKKETLAKHESICQKVNQKKRPVFNSQNQRKVPLPEDYKGPISQTKPPSRKITPAKSTIPKPETFTIGGSEYQRWPKPQREEEKLDKWKEKVEQEFERRDETKAKQRIKRVPSKARSLDDARLTGVKKPMHRDRRTMVECPHCLRTFQEHSAPRHIKFCEELHNRMPVYKDNWDAKWKLAMRTQYQPPSPKQKSLPPTPPGRLTPLPPPHRSSYRPKAPVVEEGISSSMPMDDMGYHDHQFGTGRRLQIRENTMMPSLYNTQIDVADSLAQPVHQRKQRSKMVTYGAVQPFSGPVLGKDALTNRKTRFTTNQSALATSQVYPDQSPYVLDSSVQADLALASHLDTASVKLQTDSPRSNHDNQLTNQLAVPKLQLASPVYATPAYWGPASTVYTTPSPWQTYRGGPLPIHMASSENAYLQSAPRLMWPSHDGHLPDVIPQPASSTPRYIDYPPAASQELHYRPAALSAYYSPESHRPQYQYYTSPYPPRNRYHAEPPHKPGHQYRNLLTRDNTLLDEDHLFSPGGPLHHHHHSNPASHHHSHKFCTNCGSKFHTAASRFCPDCGAINDNQL